MQKDLKSCEKRFLKFQHRTKYLIPKNINKTSFNGWWRNHQLRKRIHNCWNKLSRLCLHWFKVSNFAAGALHWIVLPLPELISITVGFITRDSIRQTLRGKITTRQIISHLEQHARWKISSWRNGRIVGQTLISLSTDGGRPNQSCQRTSETASHSLTSSLYLISFHEKLISSWFVTVYSEEILDWSSSVAKWVNTYKERAWWCAEVLETLFDRRWLIILRLCQFYVSFKWKIICRENHKIKVSVKNIFH